MGWKFWEKKPKDSDTDLSVDDVDDFKGAPDADPANPDRVNRRIGDINGVVVIALAGALIYSLTWNLKQKPHVETQVVFVGFTDDNKRSYYFMEPRETAGDRALFFAEQTGEDYIRYYNELTSDQSEMTRRWNPGGWIWARSSPEIFSGFQVIATKAWNTMTSTHIGQKPKDIHCQSVGDGALSCTFSTVQVDGSGKERGQQTKWTVSINYEWLTSMPVKQANMNRTGWIVTSYEPSVAS